MRAKVAGDGTKAKPWKLKTPSGSSEYEMYRAEDADPPAIACTVGKTELRYQLRAIEDLHAMLKKHGEPSRRGDGRRRIRSRAGMD